MLPSPFQFPVSFPSDEARGRERDERGRKRKSCDFCTLRKRRCDGKSPCSFCIAKNQPECHYSVRLPTGPRANGASKRASEASALTAHGGFGEAGLFSSEGIVSAAFPLKRARLSPSAATGLVGLRENVFIEDFFRTMGFMPFTNESFIRKAMVSSMFRTMSEQDPTFPVSAEGFCDGEEKMGPGEGAMVHTAGGGDGFVTESKVESASATCVLWSTVGVGCLIGGRPKSSVDRYMRLAREALAVCFDDGSVATARAFTAIALFHNFLGNKDKFNRNIQSAKSIMQALPSQAIPADLADTHLFVKVCDVVGYQERLDDGNLRDVATTVESGYESCSSMIKDPKLFHQDELCRWLLKTDLRLAACFSMDMHDKGAFKETSTPPVPGPAYSANSGGRGGGELSTSIPPHLVYDDAVAVAVAEENIAREVCGFGYKRLENTPEPPPPGERSLKLAAAVLPDFRMLMKGTESPIVRGGAGELLFRGILGYVSGLQGQQQPCVDSLWHCADILVKSPGLCRFSAWTHLAHCTLSCMLFSDNADKYEELRNAYNSVIDEGDLRVPPKEEWRGMAGICEHVFCRSMYSFATERRRQASSVQCCAPAAGKSCDPAGPGSPQPGSTGLQVVSGFGSGEVGLGGIAAAAPVAASVPTSSAVHVVNRAHQGAGLAPLPLLSSVPSPSPSPPSAAITDATAQGEGMACLEPLNASELEGANATGLLDAVDALLGEAALEGFGEDVSSGDISLPLVEGSVCV